MHLPFMQLDTDVIEQSAPDLGALLDISEADAGWGLVRLFKWALGRVPEGELPSNHALVPGPAAARLVARAARYAGDPDAFVSACEQVKPEAILERVDGGIRVKGLRRYDVAVEGVKSRSEQAKVAANARWGARAMREHSGSIAPAMPDACSGDAKTKTQTQTHILVPPPTPSDSEGPVAEVVVEEYSTFDVTGLPVRRTREVVRWQPTEGGCWEFIQLTRERKGFAREARPCRGFADWFNAAIVDPGVEGITHVVIGYLDDTGIRARGHPTAVLIGKVWDARKPAARRAG